MASFPILCDISKWQGEMNWAQFINSDAEGAIIRAGSITSTTGVPYTDYRFEQNMDGANASTEIVGTYWYFRPNHDPIKQADYYSDLIKYKEWNLPPVCDIETSGGLSKSILSSRIKSFVERLHLKTGAKPMIYTRGLFWNYYVGSPSWAGIYDLWVARYNSNLNGPWEDGYYRPKSWTDWRFWQFSADGNGKGPEYGGEDDDMDLNYFNGTLADLRKYAGLDGTAPPPQDKIEISREIGQVMFDELNRALNGA